MPRGVTRAPVLTRASVAKAAFALVVALAAIAWGVTGLQGGANAGADGVSGTASQSASVTSQTSTQASTSGIVTTNDSKTACIYVGWHGWGVHGILDLLKPAEKNTGRVFNCLETFSTANPQWSDWVDPWPIRPAYGFAAWAHRRPGRTLVLTTSLIPDSMANRSDPLTWEQPCAAGQYDGYARNLARHLVAARLARTVIRLGVEANGPWSNDFVGTTTTEEHTWAACFASEVAAMRSVPGEHFLFVWNPNSCVENLPFANWYPGNASVDIIGIDQYDTLCSSQAASNPHLSGFSRARVMASEPGGLNAITAFAKAHDKPLALPEWGVVQPGSSTNGSGDDPAYVRTIAWWVRHNDVAFQSYFDSGTDSVLQLAASAAPETLSAYQTAFG